MQDDNGVRELAASALQGPGDAGDSGQRGVDGIRREAGTEVKRVGDVWLQFDDEDDEHTYPLGYYFEDDAGDMEGPFDTYDEAVQCMDDYWEGSR
jgi:hypothetical protein